MKLERDIDEKEFTEQKRIFKNGFKCSYRFFIFDIIKPH
ncbi:unnamed protein product, partial [marine sediment metagenome]